MCLKCRSSAADNVNAEASFARGLALPVYTLGKLAWVLGFGGTFGPIENKVSRLNWRQLLTMGLIVSFNEGWNRKAVVTDIA